MPVELTDGRIVLRPPSVDDVDLFLEAALETRAELLRWMDWTEQAFDRAFLVVRIEASLERWKNDEAYQFFVFEAEGARLLGAATLHRMSSGEVEAGFWTRASASRRGVATAAVRLLTGWGFEALGLSTIHLKTDPKNTASRGLAEKLGARFEGEQTHVHDDGSEHREAVYVLDAPS